MCLCLSFWPPASVSLQHGDFGVFTVEVELPAVKPEHGSAYQGETGQTGLTATALCSSYSLTGGRTSPLKGETQTFLPHSIFVWNAVFCLCAVIEKKTVRTGRLKDKKPENTGAILLIKPGKDCCQANGLRCERGRMSEGWKDCQC